MNRYQLIVEYDGEKFIGWQIQKKGISIQKTLQSVISKFLKEKITVYGAGRTDAGVHAIKQSAHFDTKKRLHSKSLIKSLNFFLNKKNISILKIIKKNNLFHSRYSAKERTYVYLIRNHISPSVLKKRKEWHVIKNIDLDLLKKGSRILTGTHDFSTFRASNCNAKNPVKTMRQISVIKRDSVIKIKFISQSFLKSQVRSMVGSLKLLGEKKWTLNKFKNSFKSKNRKNCAPLAPPYGLYLERVTY